MPFAALLTPRRGVAGLGRGVDARSRRAGTSSSRRSAPGSAAETSGLVGTEGVDNFRLVSDGWLVPPQ